MTQTNSDEKTQMKPVSARPPPLARLIDNPSLQFVSGVDQISLIWGKTQILWTWAAVGPPSRPLPRALAWDEPRDTRRHHPWGTGMRRLAISVPEAEVGPWHRLKTMQPPL